MVCRHINDFNCEVILLRHSWFLRSQFKYIQNPILTTVCNLCNSVVVSSYNDTLQWYCEITVICMYNKWCLNGWVMSLLRHFILVLWGYGFKSLQLDQNPLKAIVAYHHEAHEHSVAIVLGNCCILLIQNHIHKASGWEVMGSNHFNCILMSICMWWFYQIMA